MRGLLTPAILLTAGCGLTLDLQPPEPEGGDVAPADGGPDGDATTAPADGGLDATVGPDAGADAGRDARIDARMHRDAGPHDARAPAPDGATIPDGGCPIPREECRTLLEEFNTTLAPGVEPTTCHVDFACRFGTYYDQCLMAYPDCSWDVAGEPPPEELCEDPCTGALPPGSSPADG